MYEKGLGRRATSLWLLKGVLLLLLGVRALPLMGQYDAVFSQYDRAATFYNPAAAGGQEELDITAIYHQQWVGIPGAPANISLLANTQVDFLERKHGVGVAFLTQKKGLFVNTDLAGQYTFFLPLFKGQLGIGLQVGLFNSAFDGTKLFLPDGEGITPNDPALPLTRVSGKSFDSAVGLSWRNKRMYVGVASHHLLAPRVRLSNNYSIELKRNYTFHSSYKFSSETSLLTWTPSLLLLTDFKAWRIDANLQLEYAERFRAGVMFRPMNAAGFSLGMKFGSVAVGYAFEMPINQMAKGNWGSHELAVSYLLPLKKNKNREVRYKSVRLL